MRDEIVSVESLMSFCDMRGNATYILYPLARAATFVEQTNLLTGKGQLSM